MRNVVAVVLGGGQGSRLSPLTSIRSKPAVPLAGKYRLIDIPISNCINSSINRIYILTQFMSVSLHSHIRQTFSFDNFNGGYVALLAATETRDQGTDWYQGTADAVRKNLRYIKQRGIDYVLILSGDQLYRMDYRQMIETHRESNADVTISCMPVTRQAARGFGVMKLDDSGRVNGFLEKPQTDGEIDTVRMDPTWIESRGIESKGRDCLASMGIYVFNRDTLLDMLTKTEYRDFGKEVFPACIESHHVQTHLFDGYWEDIGTIKSFYDANLSLAGENPAFEFVVPEAPIFTRARFLPPTQISGASITNSCIADGCLVRRGAVIENSVIGLRCQVGDNVIIRDSVIMGADYYEGEDERLDNTEANRLPIGIGAGSEIKGAIVDKNCRIGRNVRIVNDSGRAECKGISDVCAIHDGIPVVIKGSVLPDGWTLESVE